MQFAVLLGTLSMEQTWHSQPSSRNARLRQCASMRPRVELSVVPQYEYMVCVRTRGHLQRAEPGAKGHALLSAGDHACSPLSWPQR